jgi:hypothetical protein
MVKPRALAVFILITSSNFVRIVSFVVRSAVPAPRPHGLAPPGVETPVNLACSLCRHP